jgi:2-polyprenyl-6-methoxyphenol hydroxylase-like FAD-dependent oxidoreductase
MTHEPTLLPEGPWDAVVVGAGPAGSLAAHGLARRGRRVLLVERRRFPRDKVCGGCLSAKALRALQDADLTRTHARCRTAPAMAQLKLADPAGRADIALPGGVVVARQRFDAALAAEAEAAGAHAAFGWTAAVVPAGPGESGPQVTLTAGSRRFVLRPRVCLVASGLGPSPVAGAPTPLPLGGPGRIGAGARLAAAGRAYPPGQVTMATSASGYVGLAADGGGALAVAAALDPAALAGGRGLAAPVADILDACGLPLPAGLAEAAWRGTPPLRRRPPALAGPRILLLGDAAGYVEPFTGEGMAWAIESGRAAAALADRRMADWTGAEAAWAAWHASAVRPGHRRCRLVADTLARPALRRGAIAALARVPWLSAPLVRRIAAGRASVPAERPA